MWPSSWPTHNGSDLCFPQIFEKSWQYAKEVNACFVDLEKAFDRIPRDKLWAVLLQHGINGQLLTAIKSQYNHAFQGLCSC